MHAIVLATTSWKPWSQQNSNVRDWKPQTLNGKFIYSEGTDMRRPDRRSRPSVGFTWSPSNQAVTNCAQKPLPTQRHANEQPVVHLSLLMERCEGRHGESVYDRGCAKRIVHHSHVLSVRTRPERGKLLDSTMEGRSTMIQKEGQNLCPLVGQ